MSGVIQMLLAGVKKAVVDPFFNYVTLLLPGNGTNGAQNNTFVDSSTNAFTITRNGNTTQGTFSPFSQTGWGAYFDGSGDSLTATNNAAYDFGSGAFTIEAWAFPTTASQLAFAARGQSTGFEGWIVSTTNFLATTNGSSWDITITFTTALTANAWNHVAIVRNGNVYTAYLNGVANGTTTVSGSIVAGTAVAVIGQRAGQTDYSGYISNLRIVKGTAVYTAAFTPPTAPLTAIANTSLLTCQSNRFIDNSSNAFAITVNGNTSIQAFSPFNPTAAWSAATNGGSGYFDGSGDQLGIANNAAFEIGNGDFSYEAWVYALRQTNTFGQGIISYGITGNTGSSTCDIQIRNDGYLQLAYATGASGTLTDSSLFPINQWVHTVACRSGSTLSLFANGSRVATTTTSATVGTGGTMTIGGQWYANQPQRQLQGYISDARVLKGASAYDATQSTITIPTSPVTAISGTSLLTNFTNGGIFDATAKNDLETVGNAQISTTQSQWGGSSMYFDGTGDWLLSNVATPNLYAFGTGDFTIEMWARFAAVGSGAVHHFYDNRPASTDGAYTTLRTNSSAQLEYVANGTARITGATLTTGVWYHIAVCRSGTDTKLFVNGVQSGSTYTDSTNYLNPAARPLVGASGYHLGGLNGFNGYIQDLRVTKGVARYTTGFTPPTAAFPLN